MPAFGQGKGPGFKVANGWQWPCQSPPSIVERSWPFVNLEVVKVRQQLPRSRWSFEHSHPHTKNAQKVQNSKLFDKSESFKREHLVMPCSNSGRLCEGHELSRNCGILHTVFLFWSDGTGFIWLAHNGHIILMLLKSCSGIFGTLEWKMCLHSRSVKGRFCLHIHVVSQPRWQTSGIPRSSSAKLFSSALKSFWFKCQDVNHT